jgi:hypothetical protein
VHKPQALLFAKAVGSNALRQIYRKSKQLRMSPLTMTAIVAYLETRRNCNLEVDGDKCIPLAEEVLKKLDDLYLKAVTGRLEAEKFGGLARESGGFFHLAMLALKHLEFEMGTLMQKGTGTEEFIEIMQPIDVEAEMDVVFYANDKITNQKIDLNKDKPRKRHIDIVLGTEGGSESERVFIEVKSWQTPLDRKRIKRWKLDTAGGTHRQFVSDRVLLADHSDVDKENGGPKAKDFHWRFQKFNRKSGSKVQSLTAAELNKIRSELHALPSGDLKAAAVSLFGPRLADPRLNKKTSEKNATRRRIQELSVKRWMLDFGKKFLLQDIEPQDITDMIENELYE